MTPEQRKSYQEYLADFDPTPQYGGDDYDYPMSADAWLAEQEDLKLVMERRGGPRTRMTLEELSMRSQEETPEQMQDKAFYKFVEKNSAALTTLADS